MKFHIVIGDSNPRLFADLSSEFIDANIPEDDKIIYQPGQVLKFYYKKDETWVDKTVAVVENNEGKEVKVVVQFNTDEFEQSGVYDGYFRNEDLNISFPNDGSFVEIVVNKKAT